MKGKIGAALRFDGANDYVGFGDVLNSVTVPFAAAAWVNLQAGGESPVFHSDDDAGTYYGFWIEIKPGNKLVVNYGDGTGNAAANRRTKKSGLVVTPGTWVHIAAVVRGPTDMSLFVGGTDAGGSYSGTGGAMVRSAGPAVLGTFTPWGPNYFNGMMDDVRIYNRALSAEEVKAVAAAGPAEDDPNEAWATLEKRCSARRITAAEEVALDRDIGAFKERHGKAGLDPSLRRRIRLAVERAKRASGLVGHWAFDEGGGSVARDSSGRGKHGRIQGGARWAKGKIGAALAFDGVRGHVRLPAGFADLRSGFTVALWAYPTAAKKWARFIDLGNGADAQNIVLTRDRTFDTIALEDKGGSAGNTGVPATGAIDLNRWQHFAAAIDASGNAVVYKDGVQVAVRATGVPAVVNRTSNYIGRSNWPGGFYQGRMDDIRIYDRALSAEEVKALAIQAE